MKLESGKGAVAPLRVTRNGRRYFSAEHKRQIVERCLAPGASVAAVALVNGFNANLVRRWIRDRQRIERAAKEKWLPIEVMPVASVRRRGRPRGSTASTTSSAVGMADAGTPSTIELQIGSATVRIGSAVDLRVLGFVLDRLLGR